jgi:hypothetical protein
MKTFAIGSMLLLVVSIATFAQDKSSALRTHKVRIDKKVQREILKIEADLGRAIETRDAALLDRLLADYYSDAIEGSEKANAKQAVLARCVAGTLPFYKIDAERKFAVRSEIIEVEGVSRAKTKFVTDKDAEGLTRVRRMWTRKDGKWLLIAQIIAQTTAPIEDE